MSTPQPLNKLMVKQQAKGHVVARKKQKLSALPLDDRNNFLRSRISGDATPVKVF